MTDPPSTPPSVTLKDFVDDQHKLLSVAGNFVALVLFALHGPLHFFDRFMLTGAFTCFAFLWFELFARFPRQMSGRLEGFQWGFHITSLVVLLYWVALLESSFGSAMVTMVALLASLLLLGRVLAWAGIYRRFERTRIGRQRWAQLSLGVVLFLALACFAVWTGVRVGEPVHEVFEAMRADSGDSAELARTVVRPAMSIAAADSAAALRAPQQTAAPLEVLISNVPAAQSWWSRMWPVLLGALIAGGVTYGAQRLKAREDEGRQRTRLIATLSNDVEVLIDWLPRVASLASAWQLPAGDHFWQDADAGMSGYSEFRTLLYLLPQQLAREIRHLFEAVRRLRNGGQFVARDYARASGQPSVGTRLHDEFNDKFNYLELESLALGRLAQALKDRLEAALGQPRHPTPPPTRNAGPDRQGAA